MKAALFRELNGMLSVGKGRGDVSRARKLLAGDCDEDLDTKFIEAELHACEGRFAEASALLGAKAEAFDVIPAINYVPGASGAFAERQSRMLRALGALEVPVLNIGYPGERLEISRCSNCCGLTRSAKDSLSEELAPKPFVRELFDLAAEGCEAQGGTHFLFFNSDIELSPRGLLWARIFAAAGTEIGFFSRTNYAFGVEGSREIEGLHTTGFDIFLVSVDWWRSNRNGWGNYVLGEPWWDLALAGQAIGFCDRSWALHVEGLAFHETHERAWNTVSAASLYNKGLAMGQDEAFLRRSQRYVAGLLEIGETLTFGEARRCFLDTRYRSIWTGTEEEKRRVALPVIARSWVEACPESQEARFALGRSLGGLKASQDDLIGALRVSCNSGLRWEDGCLATSLPLYTDPELRLRYEQSLRSIELCSELLPFPCSEFGTARLGEPGLVPWGAVRLDANDKPEWGVPIPALLEALDDWAERQGRAFWILVRSDVLVLPEAFHALFLHFRLGYRSVSLAPQRIANGSDIQSKDRGMVEPASAVIFGCLTGMGRHLAADFPNYYWRGPWWSESLLSRLLGCDGHYHVNSMRDICLRSYLHPRWPRDRSLTEHNSALALEADAVHLGKLRVYADTWSAAVSRQKQLLSIGQNRELQRSVFRR
ncbi:hypothetical protein [Pelagicoccus sp. SDUM812003]|uniref:hypothetical protein n=1 Tax=Pelagicoccus sp. SDUM812003 TaxID=3041267 RepID=UPI00280D049B|nr:hypothetical protein [Pelagicoccus sp. SDUM812003]MDQ8201571.1 hypothetical protein [Pelagicoccus sp. SDUM812003]